MITTKKGRFRVAQMMNGSFAAGGESIRVILFSNEVGENLDAELADFTESAFGGYADVDTYWGGASGPVYIGDDAAIRITGAPMHWDCTADPETIRGWAILGVPSDDVYFYEEYDTPHELEVGSRHTLFLDIAQGACS